MLTVLLLILLVAAIIVWRAGDSLPYHPLIVGALVLAALGILSLQLFGPAPSHYTGDFEEAAGFKLAESVKAEFPEGGKVLVIQQRGELKHIKNVIEAQLRGVRKQLEGEKWTVIGAGPEFGIGPNGIETITGFSSEACGKWLDENPNTIAVISFIGLPDGPPPSQTNQPPYAALMPGQVEDTKIARGVKVLSVAAHKKGINPMLTPKRGATAEDVFDMRFDWVGE